jgi:hypothetical protein
MPSGTSSAALIAAIRGGPGSPAAELLAAFALRRQAEGLSVAGVIVPPKAGDPGSGGREGCECSGVLLDLSSGETISIHQDLGPGSEACNLDTSELARACAAAERAIAAGADLVVLNRFGHQEAAHGGLMAVYQAAVAAGLPVACMVAPKAEAVWEGFAEGLSVWLPAEAEALEAWWQGHASARGKAA